MKKNKDIEVLEARYNAMLDELQKIKMEIKKTEEQNEPVKFEYAMAAYHSNRNKWYARFRGKRGAWLGSFESKEEAVEEAERANYYINLYFSEGGDEPPNKDDK